MNGRALLPAALVAALAAACAERADPAGAPVIPDRYHGRFAADAEACSTPGDPSRLAITPGTIAFHESQGDVLGVAEDSGGVAITAALTGEGEAWEATYRFALAADGARLRDLDGGMERVRCD